MAAIKFPIGGIEDGVVRIRLLSDADLPGLIAACRDPEIPRWTRVPEDYDVAAARTFAETSELGLAEGRGLSLLIAGADEDGLLGSIAIVAVEPEERRCELGYWLARDARGQGTMTRSVRLLCRWIFAELEIERIAINVEPDNVRSRAVPERCGFQFEGVLRSYFINKGRRRDAASYSLLRDEMPQPD